MNTKVLRISGPRGDAGLICRFAHQLTIRSGVAVSARPEPRCHGEWQIVWVDGPTTEAMRQYAADLGPAVAGVDLDHLTWSRAASVGDESDASLDAPRGSPLLVDQVM